MKVFCVRHIFSLNFYERQIIYTCFLIKSQQGWKKQLLRQELQLNFLRTINIHVTALCKISLVKKFLSSKSSFFIDIQLFMQEIHITQIYMCIFVDKKFQAVRFYVRNIRLLTFCKIITYVKLCIRIIEVFSIIATVRKIACTYSLIKRYLYHAFYVRNNVLTSWSIKDYKKRALQVRNIIVTALRKLYVCYVDIKFQISIFTQEIQFQPHYVKLYVCIC
eukprot:TRINITY_DN68179_c0_g1_i1.p2 TRINITY_DN68179_c0_g1~~TRINITY_DN68179_c0_g1_i1.p2  ORF type:complete len:220 (-),score=-21.98 TRINITY_DN68179_c0_g1_i1:635-1294(-)